MNNKTDIYVCDDSVEGIFTAIYKAWEAGTSHTDIRCSSGTGAAPVPATGCN